MKYSNSAQVQSTVRDILRDVCGAAVDGLNPKADLLGAIVLDSLAAVRLTIAVNRAFGINFGAKPGDLEALQSIESLTNVLSERLSLTD
jgi:acyl carrier protein